MPIGLGPAAGREADLSRLPSIRSFRMRRPARRPLAAAHPIEGVDLDRPPVVGGPVRPDDARLRMLRLAQSEMDPGELTARGPAPHRQLPTLHPLVDPVFDPPADRLVVRTALRRLQADPMAEGRRIIEPK